MSRPWYSPARCARQPNTWIAAAVLAAGFAMLSTATADAQGDATEQATADALFYDGQRLLLDGYIAAAAAKFEDSLKALDQLGTRINLAYCYEALGRTATAWTWFSEAAAIADQRDDPKAAFAHQHAAALLPRLIKLAIAVPPASRLPGLVVTRNGAAVSLAAPGVALPVDPGRYAIEALAPGHQPWSRTVDLANEGSQTSVEVPVLARLPPDDDERRHRIAYMVGAGGLVGLGAGAMLGILAHQKWSDADPHCMGAICDATGIQINRDARSLGTTGTVVGGIGVAAIAAAVVIYATAPAGHPVIEHASIAPLPHAGAVLSWAAAF